MAHAEKLFALALLFLLCVFFGGSDLGLDFHGRDALLGHAQIFRGAFGKVDITSFNVRTAIVDFDVDGLSVLQVCNGCLCSQWECGMGRRSLVLIEFLSSCSFLSLETRPI